MNSFAWTSFYMEFADRLLQYKDKRPELLTLLKEVYDNLGLRYPFMDKSSQPIDDICPFTVFGCFNKGITNKNRIALMDAIGSKIGVKAALPTEFDGIPVLNNMQAWFFAYKADRKEDDISNLWGMFEAAINYADNPSEVTKAAFIDCYNKVSKQLGVRWNLTMGLYWIRPFSYLNLDGRNRSYLLQYGKSYFSSIAQISNLKQLPSAEIYLELIAFCKNVFEKEEIPHHSFPELSYEAWLATTTKTYEKRYWIYTPGDSSSKWDEFYSQGVMGIGWNEMGDLKQYQSKEAMKSEMKKLYGAEYSYINTAHATWQFANEIQVGDIVYAKKGLHKVIGRGIVESDYIFDDGRDEYKHIHKIKWTHNGEWEHPGQAVAKTLTDITSYTDYVRKLEALFTVDVIGVKEDKEDRYYLPYTEDDFLSDVFMDAEHYNELVNLLRTKKNIILQGAPGVGKTFAAKRLAFSIIGEKDTSRVMMVQFHQSYSYEDFIMGFRPSKDGFELAPGPFYEFCKTAQDDDERDYFFIIDEINRGNLSKIFGELLMLIEKDKRGEKLRLLYSNELFSVPKNVYLIGMMNTADRSIAIIDYALRRRFAFFELEPAFNSEGFKTIMREANNPKFDALVEQIKVLNEFISRDESLGEGFRIGHSYFCNDEIDEITDEWLRAVVKYELLPLLSEYWFDEKSKTEQWTKRLCNVLND